MHRVSFEPLAVSTIDKLKNVTERELWIHNTRKKSEDTPYPKRNPSKEVPSHFEDLSAKANEYLESLSAQ